MRADDPIRLTLICGFLGAGKSTWLRHQMRAGIFPGATLIVNEAAAAPVDDLLLPGTGCVVLAGGCACCTGLPALLDALRHLAESVPPLRPAHVVLEASGLADPAPIVAAVRGDAGLDGRVQVGEVVVLVDALHGAAGLQREVLARRQVAAADCVIVTKLDAASAADVPRLIATLHLLAPAAPCFAAVKGVEMPLPDIGTALPLIADAADDRPVGAITLRPGAGVDWVVFSLWLSALLHARGSDVLRVKAVLDSAAGRVLVQGVQRRVQPPEILPAGTGPYDDAIVVIGRGLDPEALHRSLHRLAASADQGRAK